MVAYLLVVGSGAKVNLTIQSTRAVQRVFVIEDPSVVGWPTTDYTVFMPAAAATGIQKLAGTGYKFEGFGRHFANDVTIGALKTISGTTTFQVTEEP